MSFGQFVALYELFYDRHPEFEDSYVRFLYPVRMLRNACAHNNCLINQLRAPYSREVEANRELKTYIRQINGIQSKSVEKQLQHPFIHDFLALVYLYNKIVPEPSKSKGMEDMLDFLTNRVPRNKEYYSKQQGLLSCYNFIMTVVNNICSESAN